jgi:hypothetical protein
MIGNQPLRQCLASLTKTVDRKLSWESRVEKQRKTATELGEIVKQRIGAGDFEVTIQRNPETGWHATIDGREPAEIHRCQMMADNIVVELCQYYELVDQSENE